MSYSSTNILTKLLFNLGNGILHTTGVGHIGADTNGFPAALIDFFGQRFVALGLSGEKDDWVGMCKLASD